MTSANESFTLTRDVSETFRAGWGVSVMPIYSGEDEYDDRIAEIDVTVVRITREDAVLIGGAWCVPLPGTVPAGYVLSEESESPYVGPERVETWGVTEA